MKKQKTFFNFLMLYTWLKEEILEVVGGLIGVLIFDLHIYKDQTEISSKTIKKIFTVTIEIKNKIK